MVAVDRDQYPQRHRNDHHEKERRPGERQRPRRAQQHTVDDRHLGRIGKPHIPMQDSRQPSPVLHIKRLIKPHLPTRLLDNLRRHNRIADLQDHLHRIARRDIGEAKRQNCDPQQRNDHLQQTAHYLFFPQNDHPF